MLTGVEIAGLVLGSLPLLISAVEHYNDGLHPIKIFFQKQYELDTFYRALDEQKTFLRLSLIELFGADLSVLTDEQVEALQDDSNDLQTLWEDKTLQEEVKQRLGLSYVPYMNNIDKMKEALEKLVNQKCLHIQGAIKTDRTSLQALIISNQSKTSWTSKEIGDRIRFSSSEKKRQKLLKEIDDSNTRLQTLMAQSQRIAPIIKTWSRRMADPLNRVRAYANSVYKAIGNCRCPAPHSARLQLQRLELKNKDLLADFCFRILLVTEEHRIAGTSALQELEIHIHSGDSHETPGKTVRISVPKLKKGHGLDPAKLKHITNVCSTLGREHVAKFCLSFLIDDEHRLLGVSSCRKTWTIGCTGEIISLEGLLRTKIVSGMPTTADEANHLSMKERLVLAVQLAASLLQLYSTPWLSNRWSKRDISFLKTVILAQNMPSTGPAQRPVNVSKPFVSQRLVAAPATQQASPTTPTRATPSTRHPNPTLLDLGILLLELYFGQSIEQKRHPDDMRDGQAHSNTDLNTARNWLHESYQLSMSSRYWHATRRCIDVYTFDPMPKNLDLEDAGFREAVYQQVVLPLEEELREWEGTA